MKQRINLQSIKRQTLEMCLVAIQQDAYALQYVKAQTSEICLAAVQKNGFVLNYVEKQTPEICLAAVQQNAHALPYVKAQTPAICMAAVQQNGWALQYVEKQIPELCMAAVKQDGRGLKYVREQTPEICMAAVQRYGGSLSWVNKQTPEICMAAVQKNGMALQYVKAQTPEICLAAVRQNGNALQYVKKQTPEICVFARQQIASQFFVEVGGLDWSPTLLSGSCGRVDPTNGYSYYTMEDAVAETADQGIRLPTQTEYELFCERTTQEWREQEGVPGMLFTDKENGNTLFFPMMGELHNNYRGRTGHYWCSSIVSSYESFHLYLKPRDYMPSCGYSWACLLSRSEQISSKAVGHNVNAFLVRGVRETIRTQSILEVGGLSWAAQLLDGDMGNINPENGLCYYRQGAAIYDALQQGLRLPRPEDLEQLIERTTQEWILSMLRQPELGVLFTDKENGNSIFFPAVGYRDKKTGSYRQSYKYGGCWTSFNHSSSHGKMFILADKGFDFIKIDRVYGCLCRCIIAEKPLSLGV